MLNPLYNSDDENDHKISTKKHSLKKKSLFLKKSPSKKSSSKKSSSKKSSSKKSNTNSSSNIYEEPYEHRKSNIYEEPYVYKKSESIKSKFFDRKRSKKGSNVSDYSKGNINQKAITRFVPQRRTTGIYDKSHYGRVPVKRPNFYEKYNGFDITPLLSKNRFSNRIYNAVWSDCNYTWFCEKSYSPYKIRALQQMNFLRLAHGSPSLQQNYFLDKLAQLQADKMARRKTLFTIKSSLYGINVGLSYYPAASLIITKWYDEHAFYSFYSNKPIYGTQMFTQLVWRNSKYVGFGVARNSDILYLVCYFYPKGNIYNQYKKNVRKRC